MNRIFIGYDPRQADAYRVCIASLVRHSRVPFSVEPINMRLLADKYTRPFERRAGVLYDTISDAPMSTEFSLARFCVPHMAGYRGWALFVDCDFMFRAPVEDLFALCDPRYAVQVAKHEYEALGTHKMDGQIQTAYPRKNWSSLMLLNCGHPGMLSLHDANNLRGDMLHRFAWLPDRDIGSLPLDWNWLVGVYPYYINPRAVHFTLGIPSVPGYENSQYADEWRAYADA
jgi:hypothetical protein